MNALTRLFSIALLLAVAWPLAAQSPKQYERAAEKSFAAKDYYAALQYYRSALSFDSSRADTWFGYAQSAHFLGSYQLAGEAYAKTLELDTKNQLPEAVYWMAQLKKTTTDYYAAINLFKQYLSGPKTDATLRHTAQTELEECEWAMEQIANPDPNTLVERLPDMPNTNQSDFGATMIGDTLFYSSFREVNWKDRHYPVRPLARVMELVPGREAEQASFNAENRHTANTAFSPDGQIMIYNDCDYKGETEVDCELYMAHRLASGDWSEPVKLPATVNVSGHTATQPSIARTDDGYYDLYFVSDRAGGKGGTDLWKVQFSAAGNFATPVNLMSLNTAENEMTPYFDNKAKTLYFSSLGYPTLGGYDIYKSVLGAEGFHAPEHLAAPVNSSYHDVYYAPQNEETAYFASNRAGSMIFAEEACCFDLYKSTALPISLEALAFSDLTKEPLDEVIFSLTELPREAAPISAFSGDGNSAEFDVKRQRSYMIIANRDGYLPDTVTVLTNPIPPGRKFLEKLYLQPDVGLQVRTFNKRTDAPLYGVHIRLIEVTGTFSTESSTGEEGNQSDLRVERKRQYMIIGNKEGFTGDTTYVQAGELSNAKPGEIILKKLRLTPATMEMYLPLTIYFDNDKPTWTVKPEETFTSYDQAYRAYMDRRAFFLEKATRNLQGAEKEAAEAKMNAFFDMNVHGGYMRLDSFASNLTLFLESGSSIEIMVKAYASPLATAEYNMALTKRRIVCVLNFLRKYNNGIFEGYIQNGQLKVSTVPYGETTSGNSVSDNPKDQRKSIYSVDASLERRAEILEVRLTNGN